MKMFVCASVFLFALTSFAEIECFYKVNGKNCGRRCEKGEIYCYQHRRCPYKINGKDCGRRAEKGDIYCYQHRNARNEEIRREAQREEEDARRKARAMRESQVQMMAEGMARALGRTKCLGSGCRNYAPEGERYCQECQERLEVAVLSAKVKEINERRQAEMMANRPQCKAINPDGTQCNRQVNPGYEYCYRHVGGVVRVKPEKPTDPKEITIANMAELEDAILRYKKSTNGTMPSALEDLRMLSAAVPSFKDGWGSVIYYETDCKSYALSSAGPDKKFDTPDDINIIRQK